MRSAVLGALGGALVTLTLVASCGAASGAPAAPEPPPDPFPAKYQVYELGEGFGKVATGCVSSFVRVTKDYASGTFQAIPDESCNIAE
jgi:hypothetical protein